METWLANLIQGGVVLALVAWVFQENKSRIEKAMEQLAASIGTKADKDTTHELKSDLMRHIEKIEERQIREVEGLRTEMGDMRSHMDKRFDQIITLLGGK